MRGTRGARHRASAFRPDISQVAADRASVLGCHRSLPLAVGRCCCCHRCCQLSPSRPVASRPGCCASLLMETRRHSFWTGLDRNCLTGGDSSVNILASDPPGDSHRAGLAVTDSEHPTGACPVRWPHIAEWGSPFNRSNAGQLHARNSWHTHPFRPVNSTNVGSPRWAGPLRWRPLSPNICTSPAEGMTAP